MFETIRATYTHRALSRAGIDISDWRPEEGFRFNLPVLDKLYRYYQAIYFEKPEAFLWAGLARLTGGQVLYGMSHAVRIARDPCILTQEIMAVARDIFDHLAWQHELFLDDPNALLELSQYLDAAGRHQHSYRDSWGKIASGQSEWIIAGNMQILENEQLHTIQPHYDRIKTDTYSRRFFRLTRFSMRNIHPHHRRFIFEFPFGDVTVFRDRWRWISHPKGMWTSWTQLSQTERSRLVALSNEAVIQHNW